MKRAISDNTLRLELAAGYVDEAIRLLRRVDREKFGEIICALKPFVERIESAHIAPSETVRT